jgi:catechol 2,3-dioxygenase-like lactoylglutathione lyase family enzyme
MDPRISIVTLGVTNLERSTSFYRDGLGWPYLEAKSSGEISFFEVNKGTLWIALYPRRLLAEDANVPDTKAGFAGFTLAQLAKTKEDVHSVLAKAVAAGAKVVKDPQEVFWGGYSSYFADPDGFLWEVAFNPYSWFE